MIKDLIHISNYINKENESLLINSVNSEIWITDLKRRVQHYGYRYNYKFRSISKDMYLGELPSWCNPLITSLLKDNLIHKVPDQLIVNEYLPGQGIANHIDCTPCFDDTIISLSLGSSCVMDFTNVYSNKEEFIPLLPRDLIILEGESRYIWKHGIKARKFDNINGQSSERSTRISLTFRNVKFS